MNVNKNFVLGVDGGGSRTRALLATREGQLLGSGEAGASNPLAQGFKSAQRELDTAIARAFESAQQPRAPVAALCMGLGGAGRAREQQELAEWAQARLAERVEVVNDGQIVLAAGTPENWGVALIAGTGSFAWGRNPAGQTARAGGWGYLIGDEGSGFDLARHALRAVTQAADGRGEPTALLDAILGFWKLAEPTDLIGQVYRSGLTHAEIARLAPLVVRVAEEGDHVARRLVEDTANSLAIAIATVARALQIQRLSFPLALTGGLVLGADALRARLVSMLPDHGCHASPVQLVPQPARGAVQLALELAALETVRR